MKDERYLEIWVEGLDERFSDDIFALGKALSSADIEWTQIWSDYSEHEVKQSFLYSVYHILCGIHTLNSIGRAERYEDNVDITTMNFILDNLKIRVTDTETMDKASSTFRQNPHLFLSPHNYEIC